MSHFVKMMTARVKCFVYGVLVLMAIVVVVIGVKYER